MTHNIADEIERLAGEATIAPWLWTDDNGPEFPKQWRIHPGVLLADGNSGTPGGDEIDHANAALIVALRNNLPAIIRALRSEARLREALENMVAAIDGEIIDSPEMDGDPGEGIQPYRWHEEWAHYARAALKETNNG